MFLSHVVVEETDNSDELTTWVQKVVQPTGPPVAVAQSKFTIFEVNVHLLYTYYRKAGNFRGIQFSRFSRLTGKPRKLNPRNKSLNTHSRNVHPRKLHHEIYVYCLSAKIISLENFRLYGMYINYNYMYYYANPSPEQESTCRTSYTFCTTFSEGCM